MSLQSEVDGGGLGHVTAVPKDCKVSAGMSTMDISGGSSFPLEGKTKLGGTF